MEYTDKMKNRLKRAEGQIRGVINMMEDEKDCRDIVTQLSATRTAIDKAIAVIVGENLEKCIRENIEKGGDTNELVKEAVELLIKSK